MTIKKSLTFTIFFECIIQYAHARKKNTAWSFLASQSTTLSHHHTAKKKKYLRFSAVPRIPQLVEQHLTVVMSAAPR